MHKDQNSRGSKDTFEKFPIFGSSQKQLMWPFCVVFVYRHFLRICKQVCFCIPRLHKRSVLCSDFLLVLSTWCNPFSSGLSAQKSTKPLVLFTSLSFSHFFGFNLAVEEVPSIPSRVPDPVPSSSCTLFHQPPLVFVFLWNYPIRSSNYARVHFILKTHAFRTVFPLSYPRKPQSNFVLRPKGGWKEQACVLGLGLNLGFASHWLCDIGQVT